MEDFAVWWDAGNLQRGLKNQSQNFLFVDMPKGIISTYYL